MASVAHHQEHIIHTVAELWTVVNDSRRYEQENREDLHSLANHTQQIAIALARVVERLSEQMRRLYRVEVLRTIDNIIHEVEVAHRHWLRELDRYTTQLEAVLRGRITHDVLAPHVLREIAKAMSAQGVVALPLDWYYAHATSRLIVHSAQELSFFISIAGLDHSDYLFYELAFFDIYLDGNRWRKFQGHPHVVISTQYQRVYFPNDCIPGTPIVCPSGIMLNQSCEYCLITQDDPGQCTVSFKNMDNRPRVYDYKDKVVASMATAVTLTTRCPATVPVKQLVDNMVLIDILPGCRVEIAGAVRFR